MSALDAFQVAELDRAALDHVWRNLRDHDREEVRHQGVTDSNYADILDHPLRFSASYKGVPMACYGAIETERCFWLFCIATNEISRHMKLFTRCARAFIAYLREAMFGKRCMVEVWAGHRVSVRWLRRLGFEEVARKSATGGALFLILEKR